MKTSKHHDVFQHLIDLFEKLRMVPLDEIHGKIDMAIKILEEVRDE